MYGTCVYEARTWLETNAMRGDLAQKSQVLVRAADKGLPSLPSNIKRDCAPSLLILHGMTLLPF